MACDIFARHIGKEMLTQAQDLQGKSCDWWEPEQQQQLLKPVNNEQQMKEWALQWLDYVSRKKPWLAPGKVDQVPALRTWVEEHQPFTVKDMLSLTQQLGPLAAIGYDHVALERETMKQAHQPHYRFRNEWWTFHGTCQQSSGQRGFLLLQIHRHTLVPPSLWNEPTGQDASVLGLTLRVLQPGAKKWEQEETQFVRQSSGLRQLNADATHFFQVLQKPWVIQSLYQDTLFPLEIHWRVGATVMKALLDNSKPMLMIHSNGCLQCSDGIGVKMYTYPEVQGEGQCGTELVHWHGFWEHTWESSMYPKGLANSLFMRALINIEKSLHTLPENHFWSTLHLSRVQTNEEWYLAVMGWHQRNSVQYAVYVAPDGSTRRLRTEDLWLEVTQNVKETSFPFAMTLHQKGQPSLHMLLLDSAGSENPLKIGTFWDADQEVFGSLQLPQNTGPELKRTMETSDEVWSWVIWLFPLLIVLLLIIFSIVLVVKRYRGNKHPWMVSRHHTEFFQW